MTTAAKIAELKANLSRYLRMVKTGQDITIVDRETPIARIVPIKKPGKLSITLADKSFIAAAKSIRRRRTRTRGIDSLKILREERERR
jgi:prevent-host-death family protein